MDKDIIVNILPLYLNYKILCNLRVLCKRYANWLKNVMLERKMKIIKDIKYNFEYATIKNIGKNNLLFADKLEWQRKWNLREIFIPKKEELKESINYTYTPFDHPKYVILKLTIKYGNLKYDCVLCLKFFSYMCSQFVTYETNHRLIKEWLNYATHLNAFEMKKIYNLIKNKKVSSFSSYKNSNFYIELF